MVWTLTQFEHQSVSAHARGWLCFCVGVNGLVESCFKLSKGSCQNEGVAVDLGSCQTGCITEVPVVSSTGHVLRPQHSIPFVCRGSMRLRRKAGCWGHAFSIFVRKPTKPTIL